MVSTRMKLQQGQIWKQGEDFYRIVEWSRTDIAFKTKKDPESGEGTPHEAKKKEFCRLIKVAELLNPGKQGHERARLSFPETGWFPLNRVLPERASRLEATLRRHGRCGRWSAPLRSRAAGRIASPSSVVNDLWHPAMRGVCTGGKEERMGGWL